MEDEMAEVQVEQTDVRQLIELLRSSESPRLIKPYNKVYCNRNLALRDIDVIGFDMDYTLALYHQDALERLTHEKVVERLVTERGYPESILEIEPRPDFAIRGLCIDVELGNVFKMDSGRRVGKVYRGFQELTGERASAYQRTPIRFTERYRLVDTLFELPEVLIYSALMDHIERKADVDWHAHTPLKIYQDVRHCVDLAHRDDSLKNAILADPERFIMRDPMLAPTLHRFRSSGKRLFLMTNSYPRYTQAVMSWLLDGVLSEYPSWRNYFDVIITGARKPLFFTEQAPFLRVDDDGEPGAEEHERFERGRIYLNGNFGELEPMLGVSGPSILYVGDHIYGDILRSKRSSAWRTCMIVQEMHEELTRADTVRHEISERNELELELERLHDEIYFIARLERRFDEFVDSLEDQWLAQRSDADAASEDERLQVNDPETSSSPTTINPTVVRKELRFRVDTLKRRRRQLVAELSALSREIEANFNSYWGLVFKEGNESSIFGKQVRDYADLYTSRVSNLASYSPLHSFRAPLELLPHEL